MPEITLETISAQLDRFAGQIMARLDRLEAGQDELAARQDAFAVELAKLAAKQDAFAARQDELAGAFDAATGGGKLTLAFLAKQQERILDELARIRDDMMVVVAMVQRLDGTVTGLTNEVRAEHSRHERLAREVRRLDERLRRLEEPAEPA